MKKHLSIIFLFVLAYAVPASAGDLLIKNARLIDGTGALPHEGVSILIRDGLIAAIGDNASAEGVQVLDVANATVLPGLIDSHVHLQWGPDAYLYDLKQLAGENGTINLEYWQSTYGKYVTDYLRAYLACGVTTVLDAAIPPNLVGELRDILSEGNPGPRFLTLGVPFAAKGGYGDYGNTVSTVDEIKQRFDLLESVGVIGAKVQIDSRFGPVFSNELAEAIGNEAAKRNMPLYIHAVCEKDQLFALKMKPHAIMHSDYVEVSSDTFIQQMKSDGVYQVTTFSINDSELIKYDLSRLDDPLLDIGVPASVLAAAREPDSGLAIDTAQIAARMPWLPAPLQKILGFLLNRAMANKFSVNLKNSLASVQRVHEAGVPIVMGTDTPHYAWAMYQFPGYTSLREVELLGQAGLTPMEAIQAATINAAEMLRLENEIGTVEVGKKADLMIVRDDPLKDLANLRSILWTVQAGVAKTPEQWMSE